jgi:hypothetical protein
MLMPMPMLMPMLMLTERDGCRHRSHRGGRRRWERRERGELLPQLLHLQLVHLQLLVLHLLLLVLLLNLLQLHQLQLNLLLLQLALLLPLPVQLHLLPVLHQLLLIGRVRLQLSRQVVSYM